MSDSDDEFSDFLNCYTSTSVKNVFKKQIDFVKHSNKIDSNPCSSLIKTFDSNNLVAKTSFIEEVKEDSNSLLDDSPVPSSSSLLQPTIGKLKTNLVKPKRVTQSFAKDANVPCEVVTKPKRTKQSFSRDANVPCEAVTIIDISQEENIEVIQNTASRNCRYNTRSRSKKFKSVEEIPQIEATLKKRSSRRCKKTKVGDVIEIENLQVKEKNIEDDINYEMSVKVLWKSVNVMRFSIRRLQKLSEVFENLAKQENVTTDQILLTLNGKTIKQSDTPDLLNLNVCDFLEGGIVNKKTDELSVKKKTPSYFLNFQYENKKLLPLSAKRNEPLRKVMILFSEQLEKPLTSIKFLVDGEEISCDETPESLDLEKGDIIDVAFSR